MNLTPNHIDRKQMGRYSPGIRAKVVNRISKFMEDKELGYKCSQSDWNSILIDDDLGDIPMCLNNQTKAPAFQSLDCYHTIVHDHLFFFNWRTAMVPMIFGKPAC